MTRLLPVLLATVLLVAILPGCADGGTTASAKDLVSEAREKARLWRDDAELVGAIGLETAHRELVTADADETDDSIVAGVPGNDSDVGDGNARAWIYIFASGEREYVVVVRADGDVLHASEEEEPQGFDFTGEPIANWTIDSDRASDLAAAANNTYDRLRGDDEYNAFFLLGQADGDRAPYWILGLEHVYSGDKNDGDEDSDDADSEETGTDAIVLLVNAETGEVHDFGFALENLAIDFAAESGETQDQLIAVLASSNTHSFNLERRHAQITVAVAMGAALPLSALTAHVTGPHGEAFDVDLDLGLLGGSGVAATTFSPGSAGDWTVEVVQNGGVLADYDLSWCTEGLYFEFNAGFLFGSGNEACALRGSEAAAGATAPRSFIMSIM